MSTLMLIIPFLLCCRQFRLILGSYLHTLIFLAHPLDPAEKLGYPVRNQSRPFVCILDSVDSGSEGARVSEINFSLSGMLLHVPSPIPIFYSFLAGQFGVLKSLRAWIISGSCFIPSGVMMSPRKVV